MIELRRLMLTLYNAADKKCVVVVKLKRHVIVDVVCKTKELDKRTMRAIKIYVTKLLADAASRYADEQDANCGLTAVEAKLPHNIRKALYDNPWMYLVELRDGRQFICEGASLDKTGRWLTLEPFSDGVTEPDDCYIAGPVKKKNAYVVTERSIDVRISDIVMVYDGHS